MMEELRQWAPAIGALISTAAAVWVWLTSPAKAASAAAAAVGDRVNAVERRLDKVEIELKHLPDADDIADVNQQLARTVARMESLEREMQSINRALTRVENHLLGAAQ
jgi:septal ring factor EnvC (AmiA/AmiB activator)